MLIKNNNKGLPLFLHQTPRTKLINKLLKYTGFTAYQSKLDKEPLLKRLNDVVKINLEPRYVFDECIAYFGQNRIALAGYTTLQDTISTVLSNERNRIIEFIHLKDELHEQYVMAHSELSESTSIEAIFNLTTCTIVGFET